MSWQGIYKDADIRLGLPLSNGRAQALRSLSKYPMRLNEDVLATKRMPTGGSIRGFVVRGSVH